MTKLYFCRFHNTDIHNQQGTNTPVETTHIHTNKEHELEKNMANQPNQTGQWKLKIEILTLNAHFHDELRIISRHIHLFYYTT